MRAVDKEKAIILRKQGKSYKDIGRILNVGKSTLSYWLRDIKLNKKQIVQLKQRNVLNGKRNGEKVKRYWSVRKKKIYDEYEPPLHDPEFVLGLALYWGEGNKKDVRFTNTDTRMIIVFLNWVRKYFGEYIKSFVGSVYHHYPSRDEEIKQSWAELGIDKFYPSYFADPKKNTRKAVHKNGILRIYVKGIGLGGMYVRIMINKAIDSLAIKYGSVV